ncbi:alpha/beta hydrolase [Flavobacterium algicola]|uniref:alpha/beta hydrolase n=1 Tax=Flavobacterium algicola TaxID=556529 RepID=UPI001EFDE749|nr:alpha/beta hydrolase [Flavobacterium algicola]MCG9792280.1 alpha/beta hydrolase [Flavobacterium algicola]
MKSISLMITTAVLLFSIISVAQTKYEPDSVFVYKNTTQGELKMNVFKPQVSGCNKELPVIVFFFGGGWTGGSANQFYQQARFFADKGMIAISAEYRISGKHKTSPFESVTDGKSAIRYVREHAAELGIDPEQVIASGGSAGGHVAVCTGVIEGFDEINENLKISSVPNAMILFNPVVDTTDKGYGAKKVVDRETEISPVHHIEKGIPPTLIFHGTADKTVPFENAERFTKLMQQAGNKCELISYEGQDHGFFNGSFFRSGSDDVIFYEMMQKSFEFLSKIKLFKE